MEVAQDSDDLRTSESVTEKCYPNFETLDAKIAAAMKKIPGNPNLKKKIINEEEKA